MTKPRLRFKSKWCGLVHETAGREWAVDVDFDTGLATFQTEGHTSWGYDLETMRDHDWLKHGLCVYAGVNSFSKTWSFRIDESTGPQLREFFDECWETYVSQELEAEAKYWNEQEFR